MKKLFNVLFITMMLSFTAIPTYAANNIQINVDGVAVLSDVKPEIGNNRTMVPLRVVSESLGAEVQWLNSEIILTKDNMQVKLKPNSNTVIKNGQTVLLDVKPYTKNGRTFVPIRFIAETFDCHVNYKNSTVMVETKKLVINNIQVSALQDEFHMTMGGIVQQIYGNAYIHGIYDVLTKNKGSKVEAPEYYSWMYNIDTPGAYYKENQYDFLDNEGKSMQRFDSYILVKAFPAETLEGYPERLIHDVTKDEWYTFSNASAQSITNLFVSAEKNGFLKRISNTVARLDLR